MHLDVVTIFPEYLQPLRHALLGRAIEDHLLSVGVHDLRHWASGVHRAVDDTPYGGGPGMVMMPTVWGPALDDVAAGTGPAAAHTWDSAHPHTGQPTHDARTQRTPSPYTDPDPDAVAGEDPSLPLLIVPTPAGRPFTQTHARAWSRENHIVFACGRYEGIDARVLDDARNRYRVREVSIGDYVLIGGEVATLVMAEAIVRLIPGVLGNATSHEDDSFSDGLLEGPSYTKPATWRGHAVPDVLLGGNHEAIAAWRREKSLTLTKQRRPDLLDKVDLSDTDTLILNGRDLIIGLKNIPATGPKAKSLRRALKNRHDIDSVSSTDTCPTTTAGTDSDDAETRSWLRLRTTLSDEEIRTLLGAAGATITTLHSTN